MIGLSSGRCRDDSARLVPIGSHRLTALYFSYLVYDLPER